MAFWGGVVPGNAASVDALVDNGVRGFKCFLVPSGVDEFPSVDEQALRSALPTIARRGVPLLVHAELPEYITELPASRFDPTCPTYAAFLASRPPQAEIAAVRLMIRLAAEHGAHVHIVHVACAGALDEVARAKKAGTRVTAETCPHYLTFASDEIADGATEFKCAPPIREACHRDALWRGLETGALDIRRDGSFAGAAGSQGWRFRIGLGRHCFARVVAGCGMERLGRTTNERCGEV